MNRILLGFFCILLISLPLSAQVQFSLQEHSLEISIHNQPFAVYVIEDEEIPRPYFHTVFSPKGFQITRNHPPVKGEDPTDHATYHPGIWMAFGDISGHDFWRNKAETKHVKFLLPPQSNQQSGQFTVLNHYLAEGDVICEERCSIRIVPKQTGILMMWKSEFFSDQHDFYFGDQEEMGLGVRVAPPLMVENGGTILNSHGNQNEDGVWGQQADWCAYYSDISKDQSAGVILMPSPENFRDSWFHARDYGLVTANPFGRKAFTSNEASKVVVKQEEIFELKFGIFVFQSEGVSKEYFQKIYEEYLTIKQD